MEVGRARRIWPSRGLFNPSVVLFVPASRSAKPTGRFMPEKVPRKGSLSFCMFSGFWLFPVGFRLVFLPPGRILESAFLWRVSVDRNLPVLRGCLHQAPAVQI
jgi:hypothetical protein